MDKVYIIYLVEIEEWIVKTATTNKGKAIEVANRLLDRLETVAIEMYMDGVAVCCGSFCGDEETIEFIERME